VASDAPAPTQFAAQELQRHLRAISGAELPLVSDANRERAVCVGFSEAVGDELRKQLAGRGEDGYLMRTLGPRVVLLGNSPRATLYAVYHFLEKRLGCGWCVPGDDTVPKQSTIQLAAFDDALGPPAFPVRQLILHPFGGQNLSNNILHIDWLAKNRLNWAHAAPNGPGRWESNRSREALVPEVVNRGLYLEVGGHTFNTWVPHDRYAADHPEYYALMADGSRAADGTHEAALCLSNPDVVHVVAENITRWLDKNPEADAVDLWHNDSDNYCQCPRCTPPGLPEAEARIAYTRTYIAFVNRVAALVAERHPKVLINLLAYGQTTTYPPGAEPIADNVLVGLCLFPRPGQRTMRPVETSDQPIDRRTGSQLVPWRGASKHFYVYEYYTTDVRYQKHSYVSMMREDMRFFRRIGADGISSDQWGPGWFPLNMYAFARLMWDPELTVEGIISDFCSRYYGAAAEPMAAYWAALEEGLHESWDTEEPIDWRDERRADLVRQAIAAADDPAIEARVRATAALHGLVVE
jgi:hypothetical protein